MEAIIKEIKKLNELSLDDIQSIIHQNFDKLEHNHTMLNNLGKQTETIEQFLIKKIKEE